MKTYYTYKTAIKHAKNQNLIEAEYFDCEPTKENHYKKAYCFWNKTGNKNDKPIILVYYNFDDNCRAI